MKGSCRRRHIIDRPRNASRDFAKKMHRVPTDAEARMWKVLRDHRRLADFKFRCQVPFQSLILDFVCCERRLPLKSTAASMHRRGRMRQEMLP